MHSLFILWPCYEQFVALLEWNGVSYLLIFFGTGEGVVEGGGGLGRGWEEGGGGGRGWCEGGVGEWTGDGVGSGCSMGGGGGGEQVGDGVRKRRGRVKNF